MTTPGAYALLQFMSENKIPLTRENFVNANWGGNPPRPWDVEAEEEIPIELQDYQQAQDDWAVMESGKVIKVPHGTKPGDPDPRLYGKDAFNPDEPRDKTGRWTKGGAAHKALAGALGKKASASGRSGGSGGQPANPPVEGGEKEQSAHNREPKLAPSGALQPPRRSTGKPLRALVDRVARPGDKPAAQRVEVNVRLPPRLDVHFPPRGAAADGHFDTGRYPCSRADKRPSW